jgi:hypothetical protein
MEYSFHKLTKFLKGNKVQDTLVSNVDHILPGDTCVSSIHQNRTIFHRVNT